LKGEEQDKLALMPFTGQDQPRIQQSITITPICTSDDFHCLIQVVDTTVSIKREHVLQSYAAQQALLLQQMRERGDGLQALFDQAAAGIAEVCTASGRFVQVNQKLSSITGYSEDELHHLSLISIIHSEDIASFLDQMDCASHGELQEFVMEKRLIHKNEAIIWVELAFSQLRARGQLSAGHMILVRDITQSKLTEIKLLQEENWRQAILDCATQAIIATSPDGVIHNFNRAAEKMLGYRAEDVIDNATPAIIHDSSEVVERAKIFSRELGIQIEPGFDVFVAKSHRNLPNEHEWTYIHKDGTRFPVLLSVTAIKDASGSITGFLGVAQDITERKQADLAVQVSLHEKTVLLNEVHHRVKNNLQVISSLLRMEAGRNELAEVRYALKSMQERVRSMALLHESLYQSGTFASIDLKAYINKLATQSFDALREKSSSVTLRLELAPVEVGIDQATPVGLLVNELISNSLKHGFPHGRTGELCIKLQPVEGSSQWRLQMSDTGVGLPANFEVNRQASMGLQLVFGLARQMGGSLEIGPGPGAVFFVDFNVREYGVGSV
ncbi:MAG: PAS domain S-box protein, partial [Candidatus Nitrotoga sp.]